MRLSEEQIAAALGPDLWGKTCIDRAIAALKMYEPPEGYFLAFSGGKDSITIKQLAIEAGVKFEAHYNWTTCDPPEVMQFVRRYHPDVRVDRPRKTMWELIAQRGFPIRTKRYCCAELKERSGTGRMVVTGVRAAESPRRAERARRMGGYTEVCERDPSQRFVHPVIDWSDEQVWSFIHHRGLPYPSLYDEGFKRLGCVICPMADVTDQVLQRWPKLWAAAYRAGKRFWETHERCKLKFPAPEAYWHWWIRRPEEPDDDPECIGLFLAGMEVS